MPKAPPAFEALWRDLLRGGYPELAAEPKRDAWLWRSSYLQTYLERDVRSLRQVGDLTSFQASNCEALTRVPDGHILESCYDEF